MFGSQKLSRSASLGLLRGGERLGERDRPRDPDEEPDPHANLPPTPVVTAARSRTVLPPWWIGPLGGRAGRGASRRTGACRSGGFGRTRRGADRYGDAVTPTLPPVELVRPGLWSIAVPFPDNPLGYTLVYLVESDRGPVLVDAGWDDDESWDALVAGFRTAGSDISACYGVLVTHVHPDHHGLSGRVRGGVGRMGRDARARQRDDRAPVEGDGRRARTHAGADAIVARTSPTSSSPCCSMPGPPRTS